MVPRCHISSFLLGKYLLGCKTFLCKRILKKIIWFHRCGRHRHLVVLLNIIYALFFVAHVHIHEIYNQSQTNTQMQNDHIQTHLSDNKLLSQCLCLFVMHSSSMYSLFQPSIIVRKMLFGCLDSLCAVFFLSFWVNFDCEFI